MKEHVCLHFCRLFENKINLNFKKFVLLFYSMEYRIFRSIDQHTFDTKWKEKNNVEHRTDIYFLLFEDEFGLKLRNKKKLELKKRQQRLQNGQEYWIKTLHSNKKSSIDKLESIIDILKQSNENHLIDRFHSIQPMILCYLKKYRQQSLLNFNLSYELTGFRLQFIRANDQQQIGTDLYFETMCIEHSTSNSIDENVVRDFTQELCQPMGYPEFLNREYKKLMD